ncbi:MAG: sugar isomerase [Flavicella sp.]
MRISQEKIYDSHKDTLETHRNQYQYLAETLSRNNHSVQYLLSKLQKLQIAIPSWALGAGGTRFGRFSYGGEPKDLCQKIEDVGMLHALTKSAGAISLHIPWDTPKDYVEIREIANNLGIQFDAINSNTFQDQKGNKESYKFGSLSHSRAAVREQAIAHNKEVIEIGKALGSKSLTLWLADGASFPGQNNFQNAFLNTQDSLIEIYKSLPDDWKMLIEYKPYEPNFYSTVIQDWGTSLLLANACGKKAYTLVDLGHHLPNCNIEQIVALLQLKGKLGGFHFNDSSYGDDDLTVGSIKPYALFLIFKELVDAMETSEEHSELAWMIDASHNVKDPMEDLIQSLEAIKEAYAKALLIDRKALEIAQNENDVVRCQEILHEAYKTDVRPLLAQARIEQGGALHPINTYRSLEIRKQLIKSRGTQSVATGL